MAILRTPATLDEALAVLAADPATRPVAGGVGLLLGHALADRAGPPDGDWLAIGRLRELRGIVLDRSRASLSIGAAATIDELAGASAIPGLLRAAATAIANPGIRVAGTLGGNLVALGARSDLAAALVALGAIVELARLGERRRLQLDQVRRGAFRLRSGELLVRIVVPADDGAGWGYERLPFRGAADGSVATVAAVVGPGRSPAARVAASGVAARIIRFPAVEELLTVQATAPTGASRPGAEFEAAAAADLRPVVLRPDERVSAWYLRAVVPALVGRAALMAAAGPRSTGTGRTPGPRAGT